MDERLLVLFRAFDDVCRQLGIDYNIVSDERDRQGYLVRHEHQAKIDDLFRKIQKVVDDNGLHMEVDGQHRGGTLFTFTLGAIVEEITPELDRMVDDAINALAMQLVAIADTEIRDTASGIDIEMEVQKKELLDKLLCRAVNKLSARQEVEHVGAHSVRGARERNDSSGDPGINVVTPSDTLDLMPQLSQTGEGESGAGVTQLPVVIAVEDQYRWPSGKVRRKQSAWPQAFGRTKSYGGVVNGYAKVSPRSTKVVWKGVQESSELQEQANRIKDLDTLFVELIQGTKSQDRHKIADLGCMMTELAAGSEPLTNLVTDAVNSASYFDANDVGYAHDRFKKLFMTKPVAEAPNVRYTAEKGQAVVVKEQFEVECPWSDKNIVVPISESGIIEAAGALTTVSFPCVPYKVRAKFTPWMFAKYLSPVSSTLSKGLRSLDGLISEDKVVHP